MRSFLVEVFTDGRPRQSAVPITVTASSWGPAYRKAASAAKTHGFIDRGLRIMSLRLTAIKK